MKLSDQYMLKTVAGSHIVVPLGEKVVDFNAVMSLNETGAFLWHALEKETSEAGLVDALLEAYDVDAQTAQRDVAAFLETLKEHGILLA